MSLGLVVAAIILAALSGLPGVFLPRTAVLGQRLAALFMVASMFTGLAGVALRFTGVADEPRFFPWPSMGGGLVGVDSLSAFFLCPVLLMGGLGSVFGLGYWPQARHRGNGRKLTLFWGVLVAGMSLLVIARQALVLLLGWEFMALSAFLLVSTEDRKAESRQAGWIYLVATHIGTLTLFGLFVLWNHATGSFDLVPADPSRIDLGVLNALFGLALLGFGLKAGMMPLHFWLPGAHANAPTHVSAMLSGVVLKMGIYGLVRFLLLLPEPPLIWGALILVLGAVSGLLGVVFAIAQHDLKRLLAYHSVENIGIILMGLGLAMVGRSAGNPALIVLGLAGCLLHVWNHSLFKSLLFFAAGSVIHRTHTRQIDRMGGLARNMPFSALLFLVGAVAICGLPPLNGFVSELLVYLGLFRAMTGGGVSGIAIAALAPILAMIGALAVACFVKVYGTVFLGNPRFESPHPPVEVGASMLVPMAVLALACLLIGLGPGLVAPVLDAVVRDWSLATALAPVGVGAFSPLGAVGMLAAILLGLVLVLGLAQYLRQRQPPRGPTWDCGYAAPTSRMQYTASSLASSIVGLFAWALKPSEHRPSLRQAFPVEASLSTHVEDQILDRVLLPGGERFSRVAGWFRRFQQGLAQYYIAYILVALVVLLCTQIPFQDLWAQLFVR